MDIDTERPRGRYDGKTHLRRRAPRVAVLAAASFIGVAIPAGTAFAATTGTGTSTATTTSGSLSIGSTTPETISSPVGGTASGILPAATWSDSTGSGDGWNGTVAVSDFTYTGSWAQTSGTTTALGATSTSAFTGTADGVSYTVTVGTNTSTTSTPYTWTSTDPTDSAGGSGTATNGTAVEIGTTGLYINFASGTAYSGVSYEIKAGTQSASALSLDTSATGASITAATGTTSSDPTFVDNTTTVPGGGVGSTSYGTAVAFVEAAVGTGMGSYTVDPGVQFNADASSWAANYTAGVQYSIVTGP